MKKIIVLSALLALSLFLYSCGGGSGSSDSPKGENPGEPSAVQLLPSHFIAQTNSSITLHAKVLDGNGAPVGNVPVSFTNLSPIGDLSATSAKTNSSGLASVTIRSTTSGFSTVQAEVNKGTSSVRDRKSLYFTTAIVIYPVLSASIDGDGDRFFDEDEDFVMIANGRDTATLKAKMIDATGRPLARRTILFSTDTTYIDCSNEDCTDLRQPYKQEIVFPNGRYAETNYAGEATLEIIASSNIKEFRTSFNIAAQDTLSGASDLFTVFLDPVEVETITVSANPIVLKPLETSEISAYVKTTRGTPVPDGTIVYFSVSPDFGTIDAFSQTTDGLAKVKFISSGKQGVATIYAEAGVASGFTNVIVTTTELSIAPDKLDILTTSAGSLNVQYFVSGGQAPYRVYFTFPQFVDEDSETQDGDRIGISGTNRAVFTIRYSWPAGVEAKFHVIVVDSLGLTKSSEVNLKIESEE